MRRRDFIAFAGGASIAWPVAARAQRPMPLVGFLGSSSLETVSRPLAGLRAGLREAGYVEGQNVAIEHRFAEGQFDRFPAPLSDLVRRSPAVLVMASQGAVVAKQAGIAIPVVFVSGADPLQLGLVDSLNRPGGNVTGVYIFTGGIEGKRLAVCCTNCSQAPPAALSHWQRATQYRRFMNGATSPKRAV